MRRMLVSTLICIAILGCQSMPNSPFSRSVEYHWSVTLNSVLWFNMMPALGDTPELRLHGALTLINIDGFSAAMEIIEVELHQNGEKYRIGAEQYELRAHSQNQWEVVFNLPIPLDDRRPVDVLVKVSEQGKTFWVVEEDVGIDVVY